MKLGEIVHDSIIENKEKTKSYWEQLMLAAGNSPSSSIEVKQSNNQSPSSQMVNQGVTQRLAGDGEPQDGPKIVETVTKRNSLDKTESNYKTNNGLSNGKRGSVIEREIQMQKEREAAFAQEREEALRKAGSSISSESRSLIDQEETLNFSIPTTDDGNFSEYGSEDKEEHSFDENRSMGMSPEMTVMRSGLHHRTQSLDSMSSGHSSGSIGSLGSGHPLPESCIRRRPVTVKPLDQPEEENLLAFVRSDKETPIEREIRLSKEREEELRREKQITPSSDVCKTRSKSLTIDSPAIKCITIESGPKLSTLPLNRGCVKKVITKTRNLNSESESPKSPVNDNAQKILPIRQINSTPDSSAKGAVPKLFSRNPNQKGLMKRFIASKGKLSSTFTFSSPVISPTNSKNNSLVQLSPAKLQQWNSFINNNNYNNNNNNNNNVNHLKDEKDTTLVGSRPGYVSAEDKIQVELQEMRKREQELKEQRARSFIRSQPDLLSLLNEEDEDKPNGEPLKLRSALSNPNLIDIDENDKALSNEVKPSIKRSPLIDVWESMIQKK